jgi:SAM-dependent methyltransferase
VTGYNNLFYDYVDSGALSSAEVFSKILTAEIKLDSLLDVGCGRGGWASRWKAAGCRSVLGVDGDYVDRGKLYVSPDEFMAVDLNQPFHLGRRFDLVQSLEVAEHLRPAHSEAFIACLVEHGDIVLFGAAVPGQGGTQHINERSLEYWRSLFGRHGYLGYDFVRPLTAHNMEVEPWYRYNSILYANTSGYARLSEAIRRTAVPANQPLPEVAPFSWLVRRAILKYLPVALADRLAAINARMRVGGAPRS